MQATHRYAVGDAVWVRVGAREPFLTSVLESLLRDGKPMYRIEWATAGFNPILNTVAISENALRDQEP